MNRTRALVLLLLGGGFSTAAAQHWEPSPAVTRLAWGALNVLVEADSTQGTRVWAQTSSIGYDGRPLAFVGSFDPERLADWLDRAHVILARTPPRVADSIHTLLSPRLFARDSSRLVVIRHRNRGKWAKRVSILLVGPSERDPWSIDATLEEANQFLQALFLRAAESGLKPGSTAVAEANPMVAATCPSPLPGNPQPAYPALREWAGRAGEVFMSFVVRADGSTDPESFRALMFAAAAFADAAYRALKESRYRPATLNGQPIDVRVFQRVSFRVGG